MPNDRYHAHLTVRLMQAVMLALFLVPYVLLLVLSLGSGWSFPHLLPDRIDFAPWKSFWADRDGLFAAAINSACMSLLVSIPSTAAGLVAGRALRRSGSSAWLFIAYLPFVLSPVVVGICLYDLLVRVGWASTLPGVIGVQFIFAFAFATVFFCEMWNPNIEKAEWLVATLGGGRWATWRHAIVPKAAGLIAVCWMQCALFSWLDYGLVSVIGGGNVRSLTLMLFAYIREASVNQAAQSGMILMIPPVAIIVSSVWILARRARLANQQRGIHG